MTHPHLPRRTALLGAASVLLAAAHLGSRPRDVEIEFTEPGAQALAFTFG